MAQFSNNDINQIIEGLGALNFTLKSINNENNQKNFTDAEWVKDEANYTTNPLLINKRVNPLVIVNNDNGNIINLYFRGYGILDSTYGYTSNYVSDNIKQNLEVDENGNLKSKNDEFFYVEIDKKGKKDIGNEIIDMEEYKTYNEFVSFENFDSIDAPNYSNLFADDPQVSVVSPPIDIKAMTDAQVKSAEKKLEESIKRWEQLKDVDDKELKTAMWSFDEIDELYNAGISEDDKRAFFVYLQNKTKKKLKGDWDKKYGSPYPSQANYILGLLSRGALFYEPTANFGERLQPRVIYQSGNVWKKWASLTNRKDEIVQRFGEAIYQNHVDALKPIFDIADNNRLRVRGDDKSMRLYLSPISLMAKQITIKQIVSPKDKTTIQKNFETYTQVKDGKIEVDTSIIKGDYTSSEKTITQMLNRLKNKHKVDIKQYQDLDETELKKVLRWDFNDHDFFETKKYDSSKFVTKNTLTLYEGFLRWCREAGEGVEAQTLGIQWTFITTGVKTLKEYYLDPLGKNPFSKEANSKDKWLRYKNDAKQVGERLFAQFLAEGLVPEDQNKVEIIWNSTYNNYVDPDLRKVPIGFTYKKYLDGDSLFRLTEFNLRAIRYYLTRGSIGLAYGVGVGKTFVSILCIKQALDLGLCTRPLIVVPNQVYSQFKFEIFRALGEEYNDAIPNSKINAFFNGMDEKQTAKGNNAVDGINICTYQAMQLFQFDRNTIDKEWLYETCAIIESAPELEDDMFGDESVKNFADILFNDFSEVDKDSSQDVKLVDDINVEQQDDNEQNDLIGDEDFDLGDGFKKGGRVRKVLPQIFLNTPSTNYDMIIVDEAHNFNNIFEQVDMSPREDAKVVKGKRGISISRNDNPFSAIRESSGKEGSSRSKKLWFVARYVQHINRMGNTILLSATPFTNSPLQLYSLMALLNWEYLYDNEMGVIGDFFLNYAKIDYAEDFATNLSVVKRPKMIGWNNVISLQKYIFRYFDKSTREDEDRLVVRPNKYALPLKRVMLDGAVVELAKENYISTTIRMSDLQSEVWARVRDYAKPIGGLPLEVLCSEENLNTTTYGGYKAKKTIEKKSLGTEDDNEVEVEDADDLADGTEEGEKSKNSAKAIYCLNWGRQIANNPYAYKCSGFKQEPTANEYVEQSPKLLYVMECIRSVKEWHEKQTDPNLKRVSGQVIYMNFQPKAFPLIRDYLVENLGYAMDEIGIISGDNNYIGKKIYKEKQAVADAFLGRVQVGEEHVNLPDDKRVKVLIGSSSIKEGINLQKFGSVLYNCFLDFNPTDRIQVEGRIWRQGNTYKNVRIVTPLMADSIDIFMFQKLEDKTERINQIWTRNGNVNDLDTTAFDPSELKYELLTDPNQIAILEISAKRDKLNEEIVAQSEILSSYISVEKTWEKANSLKNVRLNTWSYDQRLHLWYNISVIRPDLLEKPLLNYDGYLKYAKAFFATDYLRGKGYSDETFESDIKSNPNIYALYNNFSSVFGYLPDEFRIELIAYNPLKQIYLNELFNYTFEELVQIMVEVLKQQKIAFPLGYSKNWRELLPEKAIPIVEGDEVEFDTKKGRKSGIADVVVDNNRNNILYSLYKKFRGSLGYSNYENALEKSKTPKEIFDISFDDLNPKQKQSLRNLLVWLYKNDDKDGNIIVTSQGEFGSGYVPFAIDVDDFEYLNVQERNIVTIIKEDESKKKVEPTKYPEPFTWNSKDRNEFLIDILEYQNKVELPKAKEFNAKKDFRVLNDWCYSDDRSSFFPLYDDEFPELGCLLFRENMRLSNSNYWLERFKSEISRNDIPKTWAELVESWKSEGGNGLFYAYYHRIYDSTMPIIFNEFKRLYDTKIVPLGLNNISDIKNLITNQKTIINGISIEIQNLDKDEVIAEIIEEVKRRQAELNSDEIRAGSSFKARAELFANPNPDYLGNDLLAMVEVKDEDDDKSKKKQKVKKVEEPIVEKVVIEPIEIEGEVSAEEDDFITQTREFIDQLKPLLKLSKGKELKDLKEYIQSLEALLLVE
jgi:hypothetical protein